MKKALNRQLRQWNEDMERGSRLQHIQHERRIREIRRGDPTGRVFRHLLKSTAQLAVILGVIIGGILVLIDILFG